MKIFIADHEKLLRNFKVYTQGVIDINKLRDDHIEMMEKKQKELETIANSAQSLILDDSQKRDMEIRFNTIQQEMVVADEKVRENMVESRKSLVDKSSKELNKLIKKYVKQSTDDIDYILSRQASLFANGDLDITDDIIDFMKSKDLYEEIKLEEKE